MNVRLLLLVLAFLVALGCGGAGAPGAAQGHPADFKAGVEHPFFPMEPGTVWVYEGLHEGQFRHEEIRVLTEPREIWGIACMGLREEQFLDGELAEVTTEWFAEDRQGNVWKFGEETIEFSDGAFERGSDSWIVGEGEALPWLMISATPAVGERYVGYRPDGEDVMLVQSISATIAVPAGFFTDCLEILENPEDVEDQDIILYAAGVGRVQESNAAGRIDLVSVYSEQEAP